MNVSNLKLENEQATLDYAAALAKQCPATCVIFLHGHLGAGKTTFARGFLAGLGYAGHVKSPSYTLVEDYELPHRHVFHLDLYRLAHPEELEYIGIRDYQAMPGIWLVEWPEHGGELLPEADLVCKLEIQQTGRIINTTAHTQIGRQVLKL